MGAELVKALRNAPGANWWPRWIALVAMRLGKDAGELAGLRSLLVCRSALI